MTRVSLSLISACDSMVSEGVAVSVTSGANAVFLKDWNAKAVSK